MRKAPCRAAQLGARAPELLVLLIVPLDRAQTRRMEMLRKAVIALFAVVAVGSASLTLASAQPRGPGGPGGAGPGGPGIGGPGPGPGGPGGGPGPGPGGGFGGPGPGPRFGGPGPGFGPALGIYGYPLGYGTNYDDGDCYLVRRRVMTRYGWRIRRVQVCD